MLKLYMDIYKMSDLMSDTRETYQPYLVDSVADLVDIWRFYGNHNLLIDFFTQTIVVMDSMNRSDE